MRSVFGNARKFAELGGPLSEELLRPTRIYARPVLHVLRRYRHKRVVHAMAHITGGGLTDNLPRILGGTDAVIDRDAWEVRPLFRASPRDPLTGATSGGSSFLSTVRW